MTHDFYEFITGSFIGMLGWFFGGIDGLFKVLIVFTIIDYISGMTAAGFEHKISSDVGFKGIVKKCYMFMFVGLAHLIDDCLPGSTGALRATVCLFYIANEGISIIENADKLNIPIPKFLRDRFLEIKGNQRKNEKSEHEKS